MMNADIKMSSTTNIRIIGDIYLLMTFLILFVSHSL